MTEKNQKLNLKKGFEPVWYNRRVKVRDKDGKEVWKEVKVYRQVPERK